MIFDDRHIKKQKNVETFSMTLRRQGMHGHSIPMVACFATYTAASCSAHQTQPTSYKYQRMHQRVLIVASVNNFRIPPRRFANLLELAVDCWQLKTNRVAFNAFRVASRRGSFQQHFVHVKVFSPSSVVYGLSHFSSSGSALYSSSRSTWRPISISPYTCTLAAVFSMLISVCTNTPTHRFSLLAPGPDTPQRPILRLIVAQGIYTRI